MSIVSKKKAVRDISADEVVEFEEYGDDYTIKFFKTPSGKMYSTVVYETDDDSECIFESPLGENCGKLRIDAISSIRRHQKGVSEKRRGKK